MPDESHLRRVHDFDLIVMVSGSRYHGVRRSGRGLADALTRYVDVLFVDPPRSPLTPRDDGPLRSSDRPGGTYEESPHLSRIVPLAPPGKDRSVVRGITRRAVAFQIRRAIAARGASRCLLVQQTAHRSVLGSIGESMSVYHSSDDLSAGSDLLGVGARELGEAQRDAARQSDLTVAVSTVLTERWRTAGIEASFLPNGVDIANFATPDVAPAPGIGLDPPIAGVVGTLSERIDHDLLDAVAEHMSVLLVGPASFRSDRSRFDALVRRPNVQWVGAQRFEDLPSFYRHIDVGLVPYTVSAFNQASFPLKPLEYLAAGKRVVSTELDAVLSLGAPGISFASTGVEFASTAVRVAKEPLDDVARNEIAKFVARQTWDSRAEALLDLVSRVHT